MRNAFDIACKEKYLRFLFPIIEYDGEPILMVLRDEFENLFLGLCSELRGFHRWVVGLTDVSILRGLLEERYTINEALKAKTNFAYVIERRSDEYRFARLPFDRVNPRFLAEDGVYAEFVEDDCEENLCHVEGQTFASEHSEGYYLDFLRAIITEGRRDDFSCYSVPDVQKDNIVRNRIDLAGSTKGRFSMHADLLNSVQDLNSTAQLIIAA